MTRRALISKDDLTRMATIVRTHGVVLKGRVDPMGGFSFTMSAPDERLPGDNDDLDDRLDGFANQ